MNIIEQRGLRHREHARVGYMVKKRIAVTISDDLLRWIDTKVKDTTFANRSHAVERALTTLREKEERRGYQK